MAFRSMTCSFRLESGFWRGFHAILDCMRETPVAELKGVGTEVAKKFAHLGITTVQDLIEFYPRRYDDFSNISPIAKLQPGKISVQAKVIQIKGRYVRRGMHITEAVASDATGSVRLVWFNQPYREKGTKTTAEYYISGEFTMSRGRLAIMNPAMELVSDFQLNTVRIVPIYRESKGLKSTRIRKIVGELRSQIAMLPETLPQAIVARHGLISHAAAQMSMHFPSTSQDVDAARERLGFEEIFQLSLASLLNKQAAQQENTHKIAFKEAVAKEFVGALPFTLTDSQRAVAWRICQDMDQDVPMNRLVEGDVGSGKTVVATLAALMVIENKFQVAFMAPTELLARQHAETIHTMLKSVGRESEIILLVGSMKAAQKKVAHQFIADGTANFIVGTHALISDAVAMKRLGLVIVDEQHRFGVEQRKKLQLKAKGRMPHILNMTATPIPRTLALTLYGELDISIIKHKPHGRLPIKTKLVAPGERKRLYKKIDETELVAGHQLFVVCPLIQGSEVLTALSVEQVYDDLKNRVLKHRKIGLLHGKMAADKKEQVMEDFVAGKLDVLVSTTVIEVGVDVPNATTMVIEGADRFGLAQLHQLRGRVGRGTEQGHCYLIMSDTQAPSKRLRAIESSTDGFRLSELDLEIRGPGAIYGAQQSGQLDLRVAKLTDVALIESARQAAHEFIESDQSINDYPELAEHVEIYRSVTNLS